MKKAFDQTVRDIKREVNKKVLKVPGIEQKILDATSNEPWGPHGSLLADIAQATRNYHEYQMIMAVIWKRISDTGKNWRHVYKALTVLEYLVAHGSERVIDEIRERAYQISALSNFRYIDSRGQDQGNNVRKKSQSLVVLVNDKERIEEARQKAAANRDKFRNTSMGGMNKPSSYTSGGYGDRFDDDRYEGRYGSRDDDRYDHGREREWAYRDDDRYGRYGDPYSHDGDQYNRDRNEQNGRDGYRDDDYRGKSQSIDDYHDNSGTRSSDRERDRAYEDDGQYSSRGSGPRADGHSQDGSFSGGQRKHSEQSLGAPPSYEEAVGDSRSPIHSERDGETSAAAVPKIFLSTSTSPTQTTATPVPSAAPVAPAPQSKEVDSFDEFDPRGSFSAAPPTSTDGEVDLLHSFSESFSSNPLAITLVTSTSTTSEANASANVVSGPTFAATPSTFNITNQPFEDPFGDGPFRALPSIDGAPAQPQNVAPKSSFHPSSDQNSELHHPVAPKVNTATYGGTFPDTTHTPPSNLNAELPPTSAQSSHHEFSSFDQSIDILQDILPPSGPLLPTSQTAFPAHGGEPATMMGFSAQAGQPATPSFPVQAVQAGQPVSHSGFVKQTGQSQSQANSLAQPSHLISQTGFVAQNSQPAPLTGFPNQNSQLINQTVFPESSAPAASHMVSQTTGTPNTQYNTADFLQQTNPAALVPLQMAQTPSSLRQPNNDVLHNFLQQSLPTISMASQPSLPPASGSLTTVHQSAKDKFEPKSAVWADTLSRGLVNLNISGPKTNPLADIGIDFDALNRKEKRMEKPTTATVTSTVTMGKAMGSGSGIGRAGASAFRPPPNAIVGSGISMGISHGPGLGMGMGAFGGVNQPMGIGMGMNTPMNMGLSQGVQMQPSGFSSGSAMPSGYNPAMGGSGYASHPYGGYR